MKLYYFPSPNPQKVKFALLELGIECEMVPIDLTKREQRNPEFLALNPFGRVPVLTDGELKLWESHAILVYLGDKSGRLWPTISGGARRRAALALLPVGAHFSTGDRSGVQPDRSQAARASRRRSRRRPRRKSSARRDQDRRRPARKHQMAPGPGLHPGRLWLWPGAQRDRESGLQLRRFPQDKTYLEAIRARPAWEETPKLPML